MGEGGNAGVRGGCVSRAIMNIERELKGQARVCAEQAPFCFLTLPSERKGPKWQEVRQNG